jgi:hypothetical protein
MEQKSRFICDNYSQTEEEEIDVIPRFTPSETIEKLYSKIPTEFLKTDERPLFKMIEKAENSTNELVDAIESLNALLRKCNENVNVFPQSTIGVSKIESLRAHLDGIYKLQIAEFRLSANVVYDSATRSQWYILHCIIENAVIEWHLPCTNFRNFYKISFVLCGKNFN